MSQMPEVAGSWPEEGAQYAPGAPMEPVQQAYPPQAPYQQQQPYQQQGYQDPQYQQAQQQYPPQQQYQDQTVPQQAMFPEEEQASVPSEFDHLFRDSSPQARRSISARQPMVSGPGAAPSPGFPQQAQQAPQQQPTQVAPQGSTAMFTPAAQRQQGYDPANPQPQYADEFGGYDGPGGPGSAGPGPGNRRAPLIIGGAVVVIAAIGLYFGLSGNSGSSGKSPAAGKATATASVNPNETAQQQADAVYNLVKQAHSLRTDISNAANDLLDCNISTATSEIGATENARSSAAAQVAALPVGKISGGSSVTAALQAAWQASANSDQDYAKAAADFKSGSCSASAVKADPNYQAAVNSSTASDNAKDAASNLWDKDMTQYEPSVSPGVL